MMKKNILLFLSTLLPFFTASCHGKSPEPASYMGSVPLKGENVRPWSISVLDDNTLLVTALGSPQQAAETKTGQIWIATEKDNEFFLQDIASQKDQDYAKFERHSFDPNNQNLFVCSNSFSENFFFGGPASTVVVLKKKADEGFQWTNAINLESDAGQRCSGLALIGNYLFAINQFAENEHYPALYYMAIDQDVFPEKMTVLQTYEDLGYTGEETIGSDLIIDIQPEKNLPDQRIGLYLLDAKRKNIFHLVFSPEGEKLKRVQMGTMPLDEKINTPFSFANYDNQTFVVSSLASLYQSTYDAVSGELLKTVAIDNSVGDIISGLAIGKDRFGKTDEPVVFAVPTTREISDYYQIKEYLLAIDQINIDGRCRDRSSLNCRHTSNRTVKNRKNAFGINDRNVIRLVKARPSGPTIIFSEVKKMK